jgi:tRNA pseudouridine55 synthase
MDGVILVNKNEDCTSFAIVKRVKRILRVKKVGHGGTLDPFAKGLLIILLGKATGLFERLKVLPKEYEGVVMLGVETDTFDRDGRIVSQKNGIRPSLEEVIDALKGFEGRIVQTPPKFSAVKISGKRACDLARKGKEFEVKPREVDVFSVVMEAYTFPFIKVVVKAGSGFYMRSFAHELGQRLETVAHLYSLTRKAIGPFMLKDAVDSTQMVEKELKDKILPYEKALQLLNQ